MKFRAFLAIMLIATLLVAETSPEATFIDAYRRGHERSDLAELNKLRCLEGVPTERRVPDPLDFNLTEKIKAIEIVRVAVWPPESMGCTLEQSLVRNGVRHRFNMPVIAALQIEFVPGKNSSGSSSQSPLGFKDGRYWLVSVVPDAQ